MGVWGGARRCCRRLPQLRTSHATRRTIERSTPHQPFWGPSTLKFRGTPVAQRPAPTRGAGRHARSGTVALTPGNAAALYAAANTSTAYVNWIASSADELTCVPGQTVSLALPNVSGLSAVKSAKALLHPLGSRLPLDFTGPFPTHWSASLDAQLPDGASRNGGPRIKSGSSRGLRIEQRFYLDDPGCFERAASATFAVTLNGPGDVSAVVSSWYVDTPAWPEPWDCQTPMEDAFEAGMNDIAQRLRDSLSLQLTAFSGGGCRALQYFEHRAPDAFFIVSAGATLPLTSCE